MLRLPYIFTQKSAVIELWLLALALSSGTVLANPVRDNSPLLGFSDQVRLRHLYADNEHTYQFLQITPEGKVSGTHEMNLYSMLEIKAVKAGILVIRGIKSNRYLCMDSRHHLYGSTIHKEDDCNFQEEPLAHGYTVYYSEKYSAPLTLTPTRGGHPLGKQMTRFIPLENKISLEALFADRKKQQGSNLNLIDPYNMIKQSNVYSPSLDSKK